MGGEGRVLEAALSAGGRRWLDELAEQLGVPAWALARFHVGWRCPDRRQVGEELVISRCWTIPERDGRERVTAINRRYEDGGKQVMFGGRRGLSSPTAGGLARPGLLPGRVLGRRRAGWSALRIGRPECWRGSRCWLSSRDDPRPVVVLGENDAKVIVKDGPTGPEGR